MLALLVLALTLQSSLPSRAEEDCQTGAQENCLFPYFYQNQLHDDCTAEGQCSILNDEKFNALQMGNCSKACTANFDRPCIASKSMTLTGPVNNATPCLFPFVYEERTYTTCTTAGHMHSWCATQVDEQRNVQSWGPCQRDCPGYEDVVEDGVCKSLSGRVCQFPFVHLNETFSRCTLTGHRKPWCALNVDQQGRVGRMWEECRESCAGYSDEVDRCLSVKDWPCIFPFTYKGRTFDSCTKFDHHEPWCSILNYENGTVKNWLACQDSYQCKLRNGVETYTTSDEPNGRGSAAVWILSFMLVLSVAANLMWTFFKLRDQGHLNYMITLLKKKHGILEEEDATATQQQANTHHISSIGNSSV